MIDLNDAAPPPASQVRYDLNVIVARLRDTAGDWVPRYFPNGRRVGDEWRLANIRGDRPRKQGSCVITLKGEHAGDWIDFDGGQGGGPLSTLEEATGLSGPDLFAHAAEIVGWSPGAPSRQEPARPPKRERDPAREIAFILSHAQPITNTPASAFLKGRGIDIPETADLKFHPDLTHWETKAGLPALITVVRDHAGEAVAVHRTYLAVDDDDPVKVDKAPVSKPRMMLGKVAGGAVRLAKVGDDGVLGLCEGIETGLAVMTAIPGLAVWATLSSTNLEQVHLPPEARRIVILADHDASGAGARAAETAARRLRAEGREVSIALPPRRARISTICCCARIRTPSPTLFGGHGRTTPVTAPCPRPPDAICRSASSSRRLRYPACAPTRAISPGPSIAPGASCSPQTGRRGCSAPPACPPGSCPTTRVVPSPPPSPRNGSATCWPGSPSGGGSTATATWHRRHRPPT